MSWISGDGLAIGHKHASARYLRERIAGSPSPARTRNRAELPPAPWRAEASRRRGSSPSSSSSGPSSPSSSSSPSSYSAGTWRGGRCWCTCRWCRRSPACAQRRPLNPSRPIAAASPNSTSPRLRPPPKGTANQKGHLEGSN